VPPQNCTQGAQAPTEEVHEEEQYFDAEELENFEHAPPNTKFNVDDMAHNYFARADEIH